MLKNALVYKFEVPFTENDLTLEEKFKEYTLRPCLILEMQSVGFLPAFPRGRNLVVQLEKFIFLNIGIEEKILPKAALNNAVERKAEQNNIDITTKSRRKELEESLLAELLPHALTQRKNIRAFIDLEKQWLVIDAGTANKASLVTSLMRKALGTLSIVVEAPTQSVQYAMTYWAKFGLKENDFEILEDIEIKSLKDDGGQARLKGLPITAHEVQQHIEGDWQVTKLLIEYKERLQFSLGNDFILKRLKLTDLANEEIDGDDDPFLQAQTAALIMAHELRSVLTRLLNLISNAD
ncbi:recombination-associated protein RdgC [Gammaproteobacteria bacterium]|nr:recombination-associated protein RdgC [Gammaproteobacteria bacterium]